MELALIPPKGLYDWTKRSTVHMALAHLTDTDDDYAKVYQNNGQFVIIDNGAAEGAQVTDTALLNAATYIGAKEIVVPDVMGRRTESQVSCNKFMRGISKSTMPFSYMAVIQGKNVSALKEITDFYADYAEINTIGIPRLLVERFENKSIRIDLANWIIAEFPKRFNVHLLGTSATWPKEVLFAAKYAPGIRSVDTSMPFNYAIASIRLDTDTTTKVTRPKNYFEKSYAYLDTDLITERNVATMKRWVHGQA